MKSLIASQPIMLDFTFSADVFAKIYTACALVLTPKLISIKIDGQNHFDLTFSNVNK